MAMPVLCNSLEVGSWLHKLQSSGCKFDSHMMIYKVDSADMAVTMTLADSIDNGAHPVMQRKVQCIAIKRVLGAVAASRQYCFCQQLCLLRTIGRTSVDIGASAKLELVDKFCYLW